MCFNLLVIRQREDDGRKIGSSTFSSTRDNLPDRIFWSNSDFSSFVEKYRQIFLRMFKVLLKYQCQ